jgi:lipopolysaccharide export system protein LptA
MPPLMIVPPLATPFWTRLATASAASAALSVLASLPAQAEKADRSKNIVIEADKDGVMDSARQVVVYSGNAVLSQGTMLLRADRIETRQSADGYRAASASGSKAKPATWRERLDAGGESMEGNAERIDYDGRADTVRLSGGAALRRLRGGKLVEEISGGVIVWDSAAGVFTVEGGATSATNPSGRVRTVLSPRPEPASAPVLPAGAAPLAPVRSLDERR